jgi:LPXTG-motif cell wall-anchored protein
LCTAGSGTLAAPAAFTIVLPAGVVNVGAGRDFTITTSHAPQTVIDQSVVSLNGASSSTVTFDGNGATSGSTAPQTSGVPANLSTNGFTRTGYSFTGWNDVADGSGNAWGPGGNYGFVSSKTLYAQWTADSSGSASTPAAADNSLASTGFDGAPYLASGVLLALVGAALLLIARRRKTI